MIPKRFALFLLSVLLTLGGVASAMGIAGSPGNGEVDITSIKFFGEAVRLLKDPSQENQSYVSSIKLTSDKNTMVVNGEEIPVLSPFTAESGEALPIIDIAEALGAQVDIDSPTGRITITDDSEVIVFDDTDSPDGNQSLMALSNSGAPLQYALQEVADAFTLDYTIEGDDIIFTRPFQSKTLLVSLHPGKKLTDTYGAIDYLSDSNGNYVLKYATISDTKAAYDAIKDLPICQNIAPDLIVFMFDTPENAEISMFSLPTPSWGTQRIHASLMKDYLDRNGSAGTDITVAVIDSGVQTDHPHLMSRIVPGRNFTASGAGDPDYLADKVGHGTHIAGTIVDCTPENVKIMPVKVFDDSGASTSHTEISAAIIWAVDNGADIINISSGATCSDDNLNWDSFYRIPCNYAESKGVTVVVAAGNDDIDTKYVSPARLDNVITVAATNKKDQRATFISFPPGKSNYGAAIDVAAPGVDILSSWKSSGYYSTSGTSSSAAYISAAVALLKLDNPNLGSKELPAKVQSICSDLGDSGWDIYFGWGILDFSLFPYAADHVWDDGAVTFPTCELQGFTTFTCTLCNETRIRDYTDPLNHTPGDHVIVLLPLCTTNGRWESRCTVCGSLVDSGDVSATGHTPGAQNITLAPTCTDKGAWEIRCTACNSSLSSGNIDATGHEWDSGIQTIKPTEKAKGQQTYTCKRCGSIRTEDIPKLMPDTTGDTSKPPAVITITPKDPPKDKFESTKPEEPQLQSNAVIRFAAFINGYTDNTFRGSKTMSKEEFVNILFKLHNPGTQDALPQSGQPDPVLKDVTPGRWSYNAIIWAIKAGIIEADANGNFFPAAPITRAGIAVMLAKTEGWTKPAENIFSDIGNHSQRAAILAAVEAGVFRGYPDGTFKPDNPAIRVEVVTALVRYMLGGEPTDDMWKDISVTFGDISRSHWAYKYLALATVGYTSVPVLPTQLSK